MVLEENWQVACCSWQESYGAYWSVSSLHTVCSVYIIAKKEKKYIYRGFAGQDLLPRTQYSVRQQQR